MCSPIKVLMSIIITYSKKKSPHLFSLNNDIMPNCTFPIHIGSLLNFTTGWKRPIDSDSDDDVPLLALTKRVNWGTSAGEDKTHLASPSPAHQEEATLPQDPEPSTSHQAEPSPDRREEATLPRDPEPSTSRQAEPSPARREEESAGQTIPSERELLLLLLERIAKQQADIDLIKGHLGLIRNKVSEPDVLSVSHDRVLIGQEGVATHEMGRQVYLDIFDKASGPKDLVLKLLSHVFTEEELSRSNYYGGTWSARVGM